MNTKGIISEFATLALGKDLKSNEALMSAKEGLMVVNSVSFFLAGVSLLFLIAFRINESVSLTWFFTAEAIAYSLIPLLARQGYVNSSKMLLLAYSNVGIIILSAVFGSEALIQVFFIPAMGLSVLLFGKRQTTLRSLGIMLSILSYFILDYIIFDRISMSDSGYNIVRWSVLAASFITTWLIFNTFSEFKEQAEDQNLYLLQKEKELNKALNAKQQKLELYINQLEETKAQLERSTRAKSEFLATMSHEIRTPMNAILGMIHLLKHDNPRPDQIEQISILDFSGKTLLSLIDDILNFSEIEAGKIEFEQIEFGLSDLIKVIADSFKTAAQEKGIALKVNIDEQVPGFLNGDPARLTQILNNLLSNAFKFTSKGEVRLEISLLQEHADSADIQFKVSDTGIGIDKKRKHSIFESFTQASQSTKRLFGGTGLGLTISKQLVELQGGTITVESEPKKGSTFFVQLSFKKAAGASRMSGKKTTIDKGALAGHRILLAEDNLVNQKVMQRFLEKWHVELVVVDNGEEAIKALKSQHFDAILMDLQMPRMDGYETAQAIRKLEDPYVRNIPIIALTAAALKEVRGKVFAVGMNDYIAKPFNPAELERKLFQYLKKSKSN